MSKQVGRAAAGKSKSKSKSKGAASRKPVKAKSPAKAQAQAAPPAAAVALAPSAAQAGAIATAPAVDTFYLTLDASCTLREIADLQFSLVAATGNPLVVDGSAVERIDTAGLQLLVALVRRQQQAGHRLEWKAVSPELRKCGERLGLIDALALAPAAGALP